MTAKHANFDWQVLLDNAEWSREESLEDLLRAMPVPAEQPPVPRSLALPRRIAAGIVPLLLLIGVAFWYVGNLGAARIDGEIHAAIRAEEWSRTLDIPAAAHAWIDRHADPAWRRGFQVELATLGPPAGPDTAPVLTEVQAIALRDGMAMAEVTVTGADRPPYREARFYRFDADDGWLRTAPDPGFWGSRQTVATDHFMISFAGKDMEAVLRVAAKLDGIYEALMRDAELPLGTDKLTIVVSPVSVYQLPGLGIQDNRLLVYSPQVLQVPTDLADEAVLMRSIVGPLVQHVAEQSPLPANLQQQWVPLTTGFLLWETYVGSDVLADWYEETVTWHYRSVPTIRREHLALDTDDLTLLCREYRTWRVALPGSVIHPWLCRDGLVRPCICEDSSVQSAIRFVSDPPTRLHELLMLPYDWGSGASGTWTQEWAREIGAATLIDTIVSTYGRDRLPVFMAGLHKHRDWSTLVPDVLGVSAQELEIGWQEYLREHYVDERVQESGL